MSQINSHRQNKERRPKSNQIPEQVLVLKNDDHNFLVQKSKLPIDTTKFKISTSTHESPVIEKRIDKPSNSAFYHP